MRELEICVWYGLNTEANIQTIVNECKNEINKEMKIIATLRSRLMMTAYQVKYNLSETRTRDSIEAFFERYFDTFKGKYTIWELENNFVPTTPLQINT